jgi:hypothetical protein
MNSAALTILQEFPLFPLQFFARFVSGEVCFCQLAAARDTCAYGSAATLRPCAWGTLHPPPYSQMHAAHRHLRNICSRELLRERELREDGDRRYLTERSARFDATRVNYYSFGFGVSRSIISSI